MTDKFYTDLKALEADLFQPSALQKFIQIYPVSVILTNIVKNSNSKNKVILQDLLRKLSTSQYFKDLLMLYKDKDKQKITVFKNFLKSNRCQPFFMCIEQNSDFVFQFSKSEQDCIQLLFTLMAHQFGLKIMRMWKKWFQDKQKYSVLLTKLIASKFQQGVQNQDSVISMRYIQLAVTVSTYDKTIFLFMEENQIIKKLLEVYNTTDIHLKLNIGEIIQIFGNSLWTIQYLKNNKIWSQILKQAFDQNTQVYVKKNLILLLVKMNTYNSFNFTVEISKNICLFLKDCLVSKNIEDIEGALTIIFYLNKTLQGVMLLINNKGLYQLYVSFTMTTRDTIKRKFVSSVSSLAEKNNKPNHIIINMINCLGDSSLMKIINIKDNYINTQGLSSFCKWFYSYLFLPFEQLQLQCAILYKQLLEFKEICVELFKHPNAVTYLKAKGIRKDILIIKNQIIEEIMKKSEKQWQGHQLQYFAKVLKSELTKNSSEQMEYMVQAK